LGARSNILKTSIRKYFINPIDRKEMQMTGIPGLEELHLLLTYRCDMECDHCFVWSSPRSWATMSLKEIKSIIDQAGEVPTIKTIYFEGGEPFLYYPLLLKGVEYARSKGFDIGLVTNAYWATNEDDASLWLEPLQDKGIVDLSFSSDEYHGTEETKRNVERAVNAAREAGFPVKVLEIRGIEAHAGKSPAESDGCKLFFRGRAVEKLVKGASKYPHDQLGGCPEDPPNIRRLHVDRFGNLQFCQGISIGNIWIQPLVNIVETFTPEKHPIIGPLMKGGLPELSRTCGMMPSENYADACHFCYLIRVDMISRRMYRGILRPLQTYGMEGMD
jgi:hypothetical protein